MVQAGMNINQCHLVVAMQHRWLIKYEKKFGGTYYEMLPFKYVLAFEWNLCCTCTVSTDIGCRFIHLWFTCKLEYVPCIDMIDHLFFPLLSPNKGIKSVLSVYGWTVWWTDPKFAIGVQVHVTSWHAVMSYSTLSAKGTSQVHRYSGIFMYI